MISENMTNRYFFNYINVKLKKNKPHDNSN